MHIYKYQITVIIPIFNKIEVVYDCIKLNIDHSINPCCWILIDNNSDFETKNGLLSLQNYAKDKGHQFIIETENTNTGVAIAWNKGLRLTQTDYVCILNNDCVMMPGWDQGLLAEKRFDIYSPFVLEGWYFKKYNLKDFLNGNPNGNQIAIINQNTYRNGIFGGVIFFGKKLVFDQIGGFDENFWLSLEDIDFCLRARENNFKIGIIGSVTAFHLPSTTRAGMKLDHTNNHQYFEKKWGWNFEINENNFYQRMIKKYNKWLCRLFFILGDRNWMEKG